jgi:hypothetical protein
MLDCGGVTWRAICREGRAGSDPALQQFRLPEIRQKGSDVILPQLQVAPGKSFGLGHRRQYMPESHARKRQVCRRRFFDEARSSKRGIVV